jgi:hypothetical protein
MIKRIFFTAVSFFVILSMFIGIASCAGDDGNYDYVQTNEVSISGMESSYNVEQFANLIITPNLISSGNFDVNDYEYLWYIYMIKGTDDPDTLSHERNLNAVINGSPGEYNLVYQVKDKQTGLFYMQCSNVHVVNSFSKGLAVLSNVDGYANVAFINVIDKVIENIFESVNGYKAGRNAKGIFYSGNEGVQKMIVISTDEGSIACDPIDFRMMMDYSDMFFFPSKPGVMECLCKNKWGMDEVAIVDGGVFVRSIMFSDSRFPKFETKIGGAYKIAPFSFYEDNDKYFYDELSRSFLYYNYSKLSPVIASDSPLFNPADMKMDMLWGRNFVLSNESSVRAVMQDNSGNRFLIGGVKDLSYDYVTYESFYRILPTHKQALTQEGASQATCFAIGINEPNFLYYAYGSKIVCVSANTGNIISSYTMPQKVDYMEFNYNDQTEILYVAVSDGSDKANSGSVYFLEAAADGTLKEVKSFKNICGKVVDFECK